MSMHEDGGCRLATVLVRRRGELVIVVVVVVLVVAVMASGWRRRTFNNGRVSLLPSPCDRVQPYVALLHPATRA